MSEEMTQTDEAMSEQDALFCAYFDGDLSDEDVAAFEARLDDDPQFANDFESFADLMGGLHGLKIEHAPTDFVEQVEQTLRVRSRGRLYSDELEHRMQIEIVAAIMLIVMATVYLFMGAPADKNIGDLRVKGSKPALEQKQDPKR